MKEMQREIPAGFVQDMKQNKSEPESPKFEGKNEKQVEFLENSQTEILKKKLMKHRATRSQ